MAIYKALQVILTVLKKNFTFHFIYDIIYKNLVLCNVFWCFRVITKWIDININLVYS